MKRVTTLLAAATLAISPLAAHAGPDEIKPLNATASSQGPAASVPALGGLGGGALLAGGALLLTVVAIADSSSGT